MNNLIKFLFLGGLFIISMPYGFYNLTKLISDKELIIPIITLICYSIVFFLYCRYVLLLSLNTTLILTLLFLILYYPIIFGILLLILRLLLK